MNQMSAYELQAQYESSARTYASDFPVVFDHAEGASLFDTEGGECLDFPDGGFIRLIPPLNA